MDGDAEQEVVSHPFPPALPLVCAAASVLPFNPCQCASHYKLYSQPPCIVLNSCTWFRPGLSLSLGFERVTDVPPARASRTKRLANKRLHLGKKRPHLAKKRRIWLAKKKIYDLLGTTPCPTLGSTLLSMLPGSSQWYYFDVSTGPVVEPG